MKLYHTITATLVMTVVALIALPTTFAASKDPVGKGYPRVYADKFKKDHDDWTMTDAKAWEWKKDGKLNVLSLNGGSDYQPPVRSPLNIAWLKDLNLSSFVLEVNVKQTGREYGHRDTCFFFNKNAADQYYYVHIATVADPHAHSIFKVDKEPRISIAQERTDGFDWGSELYHTVRIVRDAESGTIDVYVNDMEKAIMHTVDTTFTSGQLGIGSFDDQAYFKSIKVWGIKAEK